MEIPLVVCQTDYRWQLLANILKIFDSRKSRQILATYRPVNPATAVIKIVLTSMFFSTTISHVVNELKQRKELREFLGINKVPKEDYIYSFLSKFDLNDFTAMILRILNSIIKKRARNSKLIIDCTDVSVDINCFRKPVRQKDLEGLQMGLLGKGIVYWNEAHSGFRASFSQASSFPFTSSQ